MAIPGKTLGFWSHHRSAMASKQAHTSIRRALSNYSGWAQDIVYDIFLQGSYKNSTNLQRDSDVDLVVQLAESLSPQVVTLSGPRLEQDPSHIAIYRRWQSFRDQTMNALKATYGVEAVGSGRKSLKIAKGRIPADADVVVTLHYKSGIAFFLPSEHRWIVSYPQQHHEKGLRKEEATSNRYKRIIRMFKAARNRLVDNSEIEDDTAPSYFIECLLYNVPDRLFKQKLTKSYSSIVDYLLNANLQQFKCQNGKRKLFGSSGDLWNLDKAKEFIHALKQLWDDWPDSV
jgi:hypothetical protein